MFDRVPNKSLINLVLISCNYSYDLNQILETNFSLSTLCGLTSMYKNVFWSKATLTRNTLSKRFKILTWKESSKFSRTIAKIAYLHLLDLNIGRIVYYIEVGDHFDLDNICSRPFHRHMRGKRPGVTCRQLSKNRFHRSDYCTVSLDLNDIYLYIYIYISNIYLSFHMTQKRC